VAEGPKTEGAAHRGPSVDGAWEEPYALGLAPTASLPIAHVQLASGTENLAAMTAALPGAARTDDATPIVSPLPRQPSFHPPAPYLPWYKRWQIALAGGAFAGVALALLSVAFSSSDPAQPAAAVVTPAPPPEPVATPITTPAPAAQQPLAKKKLAPAKPKAKPTKRAPVKKKAPAKRATTKRS